MTVSRDYFPMRVLALHYVLMCISAGAWDEVMSMARALHRTVSREMLRTLSHIASPLPLFWSASIRRVCRPTTCVPSTTWETLVRIARGLDWLFYIRDVPDLLRVTPMLPLEVQQAFKSALQDAVTSRMSIPQPAAPTQQPIAAAYGQPYGQPMGPPPQPLGPGQGARPQAPQPLGPQPRGPAQQPRGPALGQPMGSAFGHAVGGQPRGPAQQMVHSQAPNANFAALCDVLIQHAQKKEADRQRLKTENDRLRQEIEVLKNQERRGTKRPRDDEGQVE
ncbi:unnamed protein product [Vitrella brassicaformis CCMP3155]|uniref:Uncharacterized protein n=1 Tax=Vitrella brassicaformis (strain CCMP3155) TaxID=1169540 RepID=A0A0G4EQ06_VITBC|nr:unnamed protein product [Vitrella brassicaformis CCMP3155]|mmetsp:Transcript_16313/g.46432  ORF Transcript_16313/g.46432 Transcript_16313/m.46432 type:complete len:278 (-) Transcript_16313:552-1385(-)|eukprot:CEL99370.1 unnamed protein product [Vitrella brassicaformis CCMP3155]